jgi:hypothetical protein
MAKKDFFYNTKDILDLKELIRTGEPIRRIAFREHERFGTSATALQQQLYKLAKTTTKVQKWEGPKRVRKAANVNPIVETKGFTLPEGTTFEGEAKRVSIHADHFRIYF